MSKIQDNQRYFPKVVGFWKGPIGPVCTWQFISFSRHILYRIVSYRHLVLFSLAHLEESQEPGQEVKSTFHPVHACSHLVCRTEFDVLTEGKKSSKFLIYQIGHCTMNYSLHEVEMTFCTLWKFAFSLHFLQDNKKYCSWAPYSKRALGGEWLRSFCNRPRVRSSKELKPVVMRWSERVLPWRPAISPKEY